MSTFIMKDLLGGDADAAVKNIKIQHEKVLNRDRRRVNEVYRAVKYFDVKFQKRRNQLELNLKQSMEGTYSKRQYSWRNDFRRLYD